MKSKPPFIVIDCETTGTDWKKDRLHGVGVCWEEDCTRYALTETSLTSYKLKDEQILVWLKDPTIAKVGHNLRFDILFLEQLNWLEVKGPLYDTMLLAKMLDENQELGLKALSKKYLNDSLDAKNELDRVLGKKKLKHVGELCRLDLESVTLINNGEVTKGLYRDLIGRYCEEDCNNTFRLFIVLKEKLNKLDKQLRARFPGMENTPKNVYLQEISPLERVLIDMEKRGVLLDKSWQKELGTLLKLNEVSAKAYLDKECAPEIAQLEEKLVEKARSKRVTEKAKARIEAGSDKYKTRFLWSSPAQVSDLVYKGLKVPFGSWQKTQKGRLSVGSQARPHVMLDIGPKHKAFGVLKTYEDWYKSKDLYGKYVEGSSAAALAVVEHEGRVHGQFLQLPKTGRLSHRAPNMGNIPKGPDIKRLFVPPPGKVFFYFDYSQVEFRVMAHLCKDQNMMEACWGDPHDITARLCGVSRNVAKTINFAFLYGAWPKKAQSIFLTQAGVWKSFEECQRLREAFFEAYPGLPTYLERVKMFVSSRGFSATETGLVRRFPEVFSGGKMEQRSAERKGVNLLGQGLGASICKRAMLALDKAGYELVSQVHDSVVGVLDEGADLCYHKDRIEKIAESAYKLRVPLVTEVKFLKSFDEEDVFEGIGKTSDAASNS
jgi:DNA polymerase-1